MQICTLEDGMSINSVVITISISGLIGVNIIFEHLFDILDGLSPDKVLITILSLNVEFFGSVEGIPEQVGVLNILESGSKLLNSGLILTAIVAGPEPGLISTVLHGSEFAQGTLGQQEVANGLESLLLSHDKSDLLLSLVTEKFAVADASLLPLVVSESEELASHLEDGFFGLLTSLGLNFSEFNLSSSSFILIDYVAFFFIVSFFAILFSPLGYSFALLLVLLLSS